MKNIFYYETKIGKIGIAEKNNYITNLFFGTSGLDSERYLAKETKIIKEASKQLKEYLDGYRKEFDLPLQLSGGGFSKKVWNELCKIPYGETKTYIELANIINNPKSYRAVGMANSKNPISIFIPCHRLVGSNGSLRGYLGGIKIKEYLLKLEKENK
ncbi:MULTISPECIES: methylated-DNA--[protein]-cysteine S-methyltransferase [unclassified Clostridioides]|uniref:methylated-DNA--[protein]-cysteine S-methyltransferase n=1 Tax=unclassified Clostridioides TaxID=2635829 RepID=UPI001D0F6A6F|nr:methylated-DNA--[protein]-cysteine S-methyltransferase [Clostridioides sp. ES-S-0171-01]MCC0689073.1 methylated-DNA--[protein]-cysteine S-methyltransferase [Clostridioides sp. ES-S-0056-01]MCC0714509.1 methylated-DNA--[protein]-cysteine S-methyltransferase [Clostridioides sp. ES-S-0077-01]UDN53179.1 methylated-DNA--[protein]-cysteine S-methyltransferase [Clostridioides sp. ES-S-0054-01]